MEPYVMANADVFQVHPVGFGRDKVSLSIAQRNIVGITALILSLELEVPVSRDKKGILVPIKSRVRSMFEQIENFAYVSSSPASSIVLLSTLT